MSLFGRMMDKFDNDDEVKEAAEAVSAVSETVKPDAVSPSPEALKAISDRCLATAALSMYCAACDGNISIEEYMEMDISKVMSFSQSKALADHVSKDESDYSDKKAEVPFRNGLMISVAASVAISIGADSIRMAVHADESAGHVYPDKRESFLRTMAAAVNEGTDGELKLILPFADMSKKQVMMHGVKLGVPFAHTWSCYESDNEPCGYCVGCKGRAAAFKLIDEEDPLLKK